MQFATRHIVFVFVWWSLVIMTSFAIANDEIQFDVPVVAEAGTVPSPLDEANERLIKIVVPVSTRVNDETVSLNRFNFNVHWNRNVYPLVDYAPRTQMQTEIDGAISVEENRERTANVGLNSTASIEPFGTLQGELGNGWRKEQKLRFKKIPEQRLLIASGTIQRGTGAFFRFHPSKQLTLEGGRELVVTFRVPATWRGGVLRVVCSAEGTRSLFAGMGEPVTATKTFVVPTYLKGDQDARRIAIEYVQNELSLRQDWARYRQRIEAARPKDFLSKLELALSGSGKIASVAETWATELIESGSDQPLIQHERSLPVSVRESASEFARSRQILYSLSH